MRFCAMAAETRNNDSANLKVSCVAERVVEAATAAKPLPRCVQSGETCIVEKTCRLQTRHTTLR